MTDNPPDQDQSHPTDESSHEAPEPERRRRPWLTVAIVALVSLIVGAGGVLVALRAGWASVPAPSAGGAVGTAGHGTAPMAGENNMPGMPGSPTARPAGASEKAVYVSPARQQLVGVRTGPVTYETMETTIRTVGVLAYDETRTTMVHTKVEGWIERAYVDFVGQRVRKGQPLFSVYSPQLVATQDEYLLALRADRQLGSSRVAETRSSAESLLAATRRRLKLWDVTEQQIAELERTGQPMKNVTLFAPFPGVVVERDAYAGQFITPEMNTFKLTDLSTIWVIAQVFEYEMRLIRVGQHVDVQFPYGEYGRTIDGRIGFIYPDIDPQTRRGRVRVEFPNPGLVFKPGSYVTAAIKTGGRRTLALPKEAVIDTGARQYAILALPNGYFDPRPIQVGQPTDKFYPVLKGVNEGDLVVTSAQFLIDSEANLQEAMKAMANMPGMEIGGPQRPVPGMESMPEMPSTPNPPPPRNQGKRENR